MLFKKERNGVAEEGKGALDPRVPFYKQEVCPSEKTHYSVRVKVIPIQCYLCDYKQQSSVLSHTGQPICTASTMNGFL